MKKKHIFSTEVFSNKTIPSFITEHHAFKNPTKIQKIFPSIGLPNFEDKIKINKDINELKKDGSYVCNLLMVIFNRFSSLKEDALLEAEKLQYLSNKETRKVNKNRIIKLYELYNVVGDLLECVNPNLTKVVDNSIQMIDDKINLKLIKDIYLNGKIIFKKDYAIFKIYEKIKNKSIEVDIPFTSLDQLPAFKDFSKENIPNKEYSIIFSSEGEEGIWDIATMSMRGITSCQKWNGDYPRCLIGSILSKFVGIIYLTSGVKIEDQEPYKNLGTKMMKRCIVRYAIDAIEKRPCILIDKMYPEFNKNILKSFIDALKSRTSLPVYYSPDLGNKMKHMYLPNEKIREDISDRDWSYQDTPLITKNELNAFLYHNNKEELNREINGFKINFDSFLSRKMQDIYHKNIIVNDELRKIIVGIKLHTSFADVSLKITKIIMQYIEKSEIYNSQLFYKKYLLNLLRDKKTVFNSSKEEINETMEHYISKPTDCDVFINFLKTSLSDFVKSEIIKLIN
jgi:hypothetical protein